MQQYKSLDFAKFICAILIVVLHTAPFSSYSKALSFAFRNIVTVIAVPFFFVTSGFLAFKKLDSIGKEQRKGYIFNYLKRLAIMYLIWSAVYFGFVVVKWLRKGFSVYCVLEYVKDFFFEGSYSTIWFLPALFAATLVVYLLHEKLSYQTVFAIGCIIYVFTLGGSSYYGLVTRIPFVEGVYNLYYSFFDSIKNGICFGTIFVAMGAMISEKEEKMTADKSALSAIVPVLLFGVLLAVEEFLVAWQNWNVRGVDTVASLIPFTYFLVRFLLILPLNIPDRIGIGMRKYSILMFLSQRIPLSVIELFLSKTIIATNSFLHFVTVLSATMLISFAILQWAKKCRAIQCAF